MVDGEMIYDRKGEDGQYIGLDRVREFKKFLREKLASMPAGSS